MAARWLQRLGFRFSFRFMDGRLALGGRAERVAARRLRRDGYRILARNLRTRLGEIDLLAAEKATGALVIVEVKAAASDAPPPEVHVNPAKQRKLTALAHHLARQPGYAERPIRFDVVAVVWPTGRREPLRLTHHRNAFEAHW